MACNAEDVKVLKRLRPMWEQILADAVYLMDQADATIGRQIGLLNGAKEPRNFEEVPLFFSIANAYLVRASAWLEHSFDVAAVSGQLNFRELTSSASRTSRF